MFEYIFGLIAPHLCISCRMEGGLLCPACAKTLPKPPSACYRCHKKTRGTPICPTCRGQTPLDGIIVAASYQDAAKKLVHKVKFERAAAGAEPIARLMAANLAASLDGLDPETTVITYIPTANRRVRMRGYDQSAKIAKRIARALNAPYRPLLYRTGNTRQVGATKAQRKTQVQGIFRLRPGRRRAGAGASARLVPTHVILVDDVLTTGATLESAAAELKQAGVGKVTALVFAVA